MIEQAVNSGIATLTFSRPDAMNALTPAMLQEAGDLILDWSADASVRVIVITGAGKAFSAGVDLKALGNVQIVDGSVGDVLDIPARRLIDAIERAPQPVIAKVNGHCYTGALEIALACDLMIVATEAGLGDTHAKWGLRPTWGMSQRLARRVGGQRARELSFTARTLRGDDAAAIGLACQAHPRAQLDDAVTALCEEIISNSPAAVAAYKALYRQTDSLPLDQGLAYEASHDFSITDSHERLAGFLTRA